MLTMKVKDLIARLQSQNPEDMIIAEAHANGVRLSVIPEAEVRHHTSQLAKVLNDVIKDLTGDDPNAKPITDGNVVQFKVRDGNKVVSSVLGDPSVH